jgi:hypothetical protein
MTRPLPTRTLRDVPLDLNATAQLNRSRRSEDARTLIDNDATGTLLRFRGLSDSSLMSTSITSDKVLVFDRADEVLDTRRYYIARDANEAAGAEAFRQSWAFIHRRIGFEDLWEHGHSFIYGAINAGGLGPQAIYGTICLVIEPDREDPLALAVFPDNTALRYTDTDGQANVALATADATAWQERGAEAVVVRGNEALGHFDANWPSVLCGDDSFLEVVRAGTLAFRLLVEIRLPASRHRRYEDLWWLRELGAVLTPDESAQVNVYSALLRWQRSYGPNIVALDE